MSPRRRPDHPALDAQEPTAALAAPDFTRAFVDGTAVAESAAESILCGTGWVQPREQHRRHSTGERALMSPPDAPDLDASSIVRGALDALERGDVEAAWRASAELVAPAEHGEPGRRGVADLAAERAHRRPRKAGK